jgi:SAM-dependent methyltransferase
MSQDVEKMYNNPKDILNMWMEKLFPEKNQGCINFGYWKGIKKPLNKKKRIESQKNLYFELFERFEATYKLVLEVGCGRGHGVAWLAEKGYDSFGIDVLPSQIQKSKTAYPHLSSRFQFGKAEEIPFNDRSLDCVYSLEAAQHFSSFQKFCQESFRVLKIGGKLIISTYFLKDQLFVKDLEKIIPNNLEGFHNALSISDAIQFIKESGFKVHLPPVSIGNEVFPLYSIWQKKQMSKTSIANLSKERAKWLGYYTGGGNEQHPWYQAFLNGWIDYYILEGYKIDG